MPKVNMGSHNTSMSTKNFYPSGTDAHEGESEKSIQPETTINELTKSARELLNPTRSTWIRGIPKTTMNFKRYFS